MPAWQAVAELSDLREGEIHPVEAEGIALVLVRFGDEVSAFLDACPHEGHPLSAGELAGDVLVCSKHLWEFDIRSGAHISRVRRPEHDLRKPGTRVVEGRVEVDISALFE